MSWSTPWPEEARPLAHRVRAFIDAQLAGTASEPFGDLALAIHAWQHAHSPVIAALGPRAEHWRAIPAVPVGLYKDLPVGTLTEDEPHHAFMTSGTTGGGRGVHRVRSTALYDHGALSWARRCLPAHPADIVGLLLDPSDHPESSLSHMVALFPGLGQEAGSLSWHLRSNGQLDRDGLRDRLASVERPVFLCATAFALASWLEEDDPPALPSGSVVMVTGGFKGRFHRLDDVTLYTAAADTLQPAHLVTEYGMTELSSQLWGAPGSAYRPPPWLRVLAVDPVTGSPRPVGEPGQLRFYDLCNLDASLAIETLDEGVVAADGTVTLFGRLKGSPARGCSLTVEEAWSR